MKKPSKTDWEALASMTDEEIDYSDIPPLPEAFFKKAKQKPPQPDITESAVRKKEVDNAFQKILLNRLKARKPNGVRNWTREELYDD